MSEFGLVLSIVGVDYLQLNDKDYPEYGIKKRAWFFWSKGLEGERPSSELRAGIGGLK